MVRWVHCALAWIGGRTSADLSAAPAACHAGTASIGLASVVAAAFSVQGWRLWLLNDGHGASAGVAIMLTALAAAMFRQLAHASEAAATTIQRSAIEMTAVLLLVPGAYMGANAVPALLFQARLDDHRPRAAARAPAADMLAERRAAAKDAQRQQIRPQRPREEVDRAVLTAAAQTACVPLMPCRLQRAVKAGRVAGLEAWGATFAVLFVGMLPALLLIVLPPDACARERQLRAIEDALLRTTLSQGSRKALPSRV